MSYPLDIDEIPESQIVEHLNERKRRREVEGCCDYCGRLPDEPPCRFPKRHNHPGIVRKVKA